MNKNQKIVLVIGAIVLLIAVFSTPSYILYARPDSGALIKIDPDSLRGRELIDAGFAKTFDIGNALVRTIAVIGATLLVCYSLKDKKEK